MHEENYLIGFDPGHPKGSETVIRTVGTPTPEEDLTINTDAVDAFLMSTLFF